MHGKLYSVFVCTAQLKSLDSKTSSAQSSKPQAPNPLTGQGGLVIRLKPYKPYNNPGYPHHKPLSQPSKKRPSCPSCSRRSSSRRSSLPRASEPDARLKDWSHPPNIKHPLPANIKYCQYIIIYHNGEYLI